MSKAAAAAEVAAKAAKVEEEIHSMTMQLVDLEMASTGAMESHKTLQAQVAAAEAEAKSAAADAALQELRLQELVDPHVEPPTLSQPDEGITPRQLAMGERVSAGPK